MFSRPSERITYFFITVSLSEPVQISKGDTMTGYQVFYIVTLVLLSIGSTYFYFKLGARKSAMLANMLVAAYSTAFMSKWMVVGSYWETVTSLFWINMLLSALIMYTIVISIFREVQANQERAKLHPLDIPRTLQRIGA